MPYRAFRQFTDEDALAIVAFLRSVEPIENRVPPMELSFPMSMFVRLAPAPIEESPPEWPTDPVARGRILLSVSSCVECHSPMEKGQIVEGMEFAGGTPFHGPFGTVYASNITSHEAAGIGALSDDDIRRVLREGRNKSGRHLWVMPWSMTRVMTDQDIDAIIAALREIPPNPNLVPPADLKPEFATASVRQ